MYQKEEKTALVLGSGEASGEGIANAITLWADGSSDSESLRRQDLVRIKRKAVEAFFARVAKEAHEVTPLDVKAWRGELEAQGLALSTIYCRLSFLSSFYEWLMRDPAMDYHIRKNPVKLARPKAPKAYRT